MNTYKVVNLTGGGGSDDRRLKVSTDDSSPGFLEEKISANSSKVVITVQNPGADEEVKVDVDETQIDHNNLLNYDVNQHRDLDDLSTTTTSLWSSQKIQDELDTKINAATPMTDNKLVKSVGTSGVDVEATAIEVDDSNNVSGINNLIIDGNLTVNGTTTTVNSTDVDIVDANITLNKGGTQASADSQDAGITVEMSDATDAAIAYDSILDSKFKIGEVGDLREIVSVSHPQTVINKTINVDNNTVTNIEVDNLKAGVLSVDLNLAVDNTKLAGAQAIKDYVASELAKQDDASEISYTPNVALDWNLTPSLVDEALDELADRVKTAETSLSEHLDADPSKHNADQINFSGSLAADNVYDAIEELNTDKVSYTDFPTEFDSEFSSRSTSDLTEGTNQYFTAERAQDAVGTILTDSTTVDLTYDDVNNTISASVIVSAVDHDQLLNFVANEHIDHTSVSINAGEGLTGGGDISANRTISLNVTGLTSTTVDGSDELVVYDTSASGHRKVLVSDIASIGSSAGDIAETSFSLLQAQVAQPVTGLAFANASVRSFKAQVSVAIDADSDVFEVFDIQGVQKTSGWEISVTSDGDDSLIDFNITSLGQVTYSSSSYTGFVSGLINFRASVTSV